MPRISRISKKLETLKLERLEGWLGGWTAGWTAGWLDGWKDGWPLSLLFRDSSGRKDGGREEGWRTVGRLGGR